MTWDTADPVPVTQCPRCHNPTQCGSRYLEVERRAALQPRGPGHGLCAPLHHASCLLLFVHLSFSFLDSCVHSDAALAHRSLLPRIQQPHVAVDLCKLQCCLAFLHIDGHRLVVNRVWLICHSSHAFKAFCGFSMATNLVARLPSPAPWVWSPSPRSLGCRWGVVVTLQSHKRGHRRVSVNQLAFDVDGVFLVLSLASIYCHSPPLVGSPPCGLFLLLRLLLVVAVDAEHVQGWRAFTECHPTTCRLLLHLLLAFCVLRCVPWHALEHGLHHIPTPRVASIVFWSQRSRRPARHLHTVLFDLSFSALQLQPWHTQTVVP